MAPSVVWAPQPGSQALFLSCPIYEVLYEGTRGPGKTDALLMDFAQETGKGYGAFWRGILFRETYEQLADVISRSKRWFKQIFPEGSQSGATYNASSHTWTWATGEELLFRYMDNSDDYWNYHGHEYPWIAWEELTNWASASCYTSMKACSRSSRQGMPRKYRATANPYGVGHNWVKAMFVDPAPAGHVIKDDEGLERVRLHGHWSENRILLAAEPDYPKKIAAAAGDPNRKKAWLDGNWDVVAGGMFDDLWDRSVHVVRPFPIPETWRIDRSFDWGSSKPFSVGWWAESDGTGDPARGIPIVPRGTLFRIAEWYGWNGQPNEGCKMVVADIAKGIVELEKKAGWTVYPGPADSMIFDTVNDVCYAEDMEAEGVSWEEADKSQGSRKNGWERIRAKLKASLERPMEDPGLFIFDTCTQFIRTVPVLPRDPVKMDDVNTKAEDHVGDESRYRVLAPDRQWRTIKHNL